HAVHVLGHVHADAAHQTERTGIGAQAASHGGDGVGHVVTAGAAREREPAGDGDGPVVDAVLEAQSVPGEQHRAGEAAVEVDVGDVVHARAGHPEGGLAGLLHGLRPPQLGVLGDVPRVVAVGPAPEVHALVGGDAQSVGLL